MGNKCLTDTLQFKNLQLKALKLSKEAHNKGDNIKENILKPHQNWNDLKFQIHWNKLECVVL